jgi:hypothetical protein
MDHTGKYLRSPIRTEIEGRTCSLLTIGHVAIALGRTTWTIRYWIRLGLLPEAPFDLYPDEPRRRRRLFPAAYVAALAEIANQGYMDGRLDRDQWRRFQLDAWHAYETTVGSLMPGVRAATVDGASLAR